ncbi:phosphotransferase [Halalkalibacillus sediminis]|uniref:phosphotransferase n=1 Tax=Halalkalibacillus sediminis TaxID=2018042 RepID=UPI00138FEB0F|nr:phosphotransferase [Halalkalibacillus sediminis]
MNLRELTRLSKDYAIKPVIGVQNITEGNTSEALTVITLDQKYILRKVKDREQAITEYHISEELNKRNVSPKILLSNNKEPFITINDSVYNLQIYIEHSQKPKEINFYQLGQTISLFHSSVHKVNGVHEQQDRFNLNKIWNELNKIDEVSTINFKDQLTFKVDQCSNINHDNNCFIHGDLGIWNLIFSQKDIYIIDFGEVRRGNNHFDISAVITSSLDWNQNDNHIATYLTCFKNGYISNFQDFNWSVLRENITLWFTRGMVALLLNNGINDKTCMHAELMMERRERLDDIITTNFIKTE